MRGVPEVSRTQATLITRLGENDGFRGQGPGHGVIRSHASRVRRLFSPYQSRHILGLGMYSRRSSGQNSNSIAISISRFRGSRAHQKMHLPLVPPKMLVSGPAADVGAVHSGTDWRSTYLTTQKRDSPKTFKLRGSLF